MVVDAAPPRIVGALLHCLFKSHTVTKAGCVSAAGRRAGIRVGRVITARHQSDRQTAGSQWDCRFPLSVESGKTDPAGEKRRPSVIIIIITHTKIKNTVRIELLPRRPRGSWSLCCQLCSGQHHFEVASMKYWYSSELQIIWILFLYI